jgi:UDP-N-acetylmuramyl pentapeptide phosphotransferase/UDP-N-acetylglucosamine-1-phosphate transferase
MRKAHYGLVWRRLMRFAHYDDTKTNQRFWIITMMLVLVGLSTLKLR